MDPTIKAQLARAFAAEQELSHETPRLRAATELAKTNSIPAISVSPSHGALLSILCKMLSAKHVLEIGTLAAYSTIWLAESIPGIQVISIDNNQTHLEVAKKNTQGMSNVDLRFGAALDVMKSLDEEKKQFDLVLVDADWPNQHLYFDAAINLLRPGGVVYVDNVVWKISRDEDEGKKSAKALVELAKHDERVEVALIPTLSTYDLESRALVDGVLLAWKK